MMCDWCGSRREHLTPVEGERLCWPCVEAYLDGVARDGIQVNVDGRETVLRPGYVTPLAPSKWGRRVMDSDPDDWDTSNIDVEPYGTPEEA